MITSRIIINLSIFISALLSVDAIRTERNQNHRWWKRRKPFNNGVSCRKKNLKNIQNDHIVSTKSYNSIDDIKQMERKYDPLRMYLNWLGVVSTWIAGGTLFYSYYNEWPLAQSFFYSIDAGMSIGFCTDVYETKIVSKAFTIIYILLGASIVGRALALFISDALKGISVPNTQEYQILLERKVFDDADLSHDGVLNYSEFRELIRRSCSNNGKNSEILLSESNIEQLFRHFDYLKDGVIHFEEFIGSYRGIGTLIQFIQQERKFIKRISYQVRLWFEKVFRLENRIYVVFSLWMLVGITWGIFTRQWDIITATHFAVSALATGGLTAPDVNAEGILPARPAIFCGVFCLFGIPLFALTLGHLSRSLTKKHNTAMELKSLNRPLNQIEFDLARNLTTKDATVHLSDFIVLQLLRQGKISIGSIQLLKRNFEKMDVDQNGYLTIEEATMTFDYPH